MDFPEAACRQLLDLALHLAARRDPLLRAWREAVDADPSLTTPSSLPRRQFNDHIPAVLDALEHTLRSWPRREGVASGLRRKDNAASHGLQRWQQGYQLREVTREWGHLQLCLADELARYSLTHPDLDPLVMPTAWRTLADLCGQGVSESATQYFQIQHDEAAGHVREMERRLAEVHDLEARRRELFMQGAHDLRGNVGVVSNAAAGLAYGQASEDAREDLQRVLQRSVASLHNLLNEVMDFSRLQAGQEKRDVRQFDASEVLGAFLDQLRPLASERGLYLRAAGPPSFGVEGDALKIQRIVQNLVTNAVKSTHVGGVTVSWGNSRDDDGRRWMIGVQDTGPGFASGDGAAVAELLKEATVDLRQADNEARSGPQVGAPEPGVSSVAVTRGGSVERGEGLGLSIVKRLCELLDASVELDSQPGGGGTTFRIMLPRRYDADAVT